MGNVNLGFPLAVALSALAAGGARAGADELEIQHKSMPCALQGQYPRIEARIEPAVEVATARVVFHSEGAADWYSVPMRGEGSTWVASLPRPIGAGSRFAYYISARTQRSEARFPEAAALIVDVSAACAEGGLPTSEHGPTELAVPVGAPRAAAGFDTHDISRFVESQALPVTPASYVAPARPGVTALLPLPLLSPVRITTTEPPSSRIGLIGEDGRSVTMDPRGTGKPVTWTKAGHWIEGRLESYDEDGALIVRLSNETRVRVRTEDLARLDVRQPGSAALGTVGALVGVTGGFLGSAAICIVAHCGDVTPLLIGTVLGAGIGATAGAATWKPVVLGEHTAMALTLDPKRARASLGVRVAF